MKYKIRGFKLRESAPHLACFIVLGSKWERVFNFASDTVRQTQEMFLEGAK